MDTTRTHWGLIGLLWLAGLLAAAQFAKISLTLQALGTQYPDWAVQMPLAVSLVGVSGIVLGASAGVIAADLGLRRMLVAAMLSGAGLSLAQAALPPFWIFLALRLIEGAAHLVIVVAAPTLMAQLARPSDQPVVMGIWGMFFGVGFAGVALVVPGLLALGGLTAVYGAHAAGLAVVALLLWPRLPAARSISAREGWIQRHVAIYATPRIFAPALGFFWHTLLFLALLTYLPRFTGGAALLPLVALIGTFGAGLLARRIAPHRIAIAASLVVLPLAIAVILVPEGARLALAIPLFIVIGLVPGASFAAVPALNDTGADRARANGAIAQLGNVGTTFGTPLFALTLGLGITGPLALAGLLSLAGALSLWMLHRRITA